MSSERITAWLGEKKPRALVAYEGANEDGLHVWDLTFPDSDHDVRIGIDGRVVDDEGLLAEKLMELEVQGWLDRAGGDEDLWLLVGAAEIGKGPTGFG